MTTTTLLTPASSPAPTPPLPVAGETWEEIATGRQATVLEVILRPWSGYGAVVRYHVGGLSWGCFMAEWLAGYRPLEEVVRREGPTMPPLGWWNEGRPPQRKPPAWMEPAELTDEDVEAVEAGGLTRVPKKMPT